MWWLGCSLVREVRSWRAAIICRLRQRILFFGGWRQIVDLNAGKTEVSRGGAHLNRVDNEAEEL